MLRVCSPAWCSPCGKHCRFRFCESASIDDSLLHLIARSSNYARSTGRVLSAAALKSFRRYFCLRRISKRMISAASLMSVTALVLLLSIETAVPSRESAVRIVWHYASLVHVAVQLYVCHMPCRMFCAACCTWHATGGPVCCMTRVMFVGAHHGVCHMDVVWRMPDGKLYGVCHMACTWHVCMVCAR